MSQIIGETKEFADRINTLMIKGKIKEIPLHIKEFEKLGYKVFYEIIPKDVYNNIDSFGNVLNTFFVKGSRLLSKKDVSYQGVITRIPSKYYYTPKPLKGQFYDSDQSPMEEYILQKALQHNNQLYINWVLNWKSKPIKDTNLHVFTVYLTKKLEVLKRAKQGDKAARETVYFSIDDPTMNSIDALKIKSSTKISSEEWIDRIIKLHGV